MLYKRYKRYAWGDLISNPTDSAQRQSSTNDTIDQVGTTAVGAINPLFGALAQIGIGASKAIKGDGSNQGRDIASSFVDPFANLKGLASGHVLESLPGIGQVLQGIRSKEESDRLERVKLNQDYGRIRQQSQGVLANYPTNGVPQAKYGMKIINFGRFTHPNYFKGVRGHHSFKSMYPFGGPITDPTNPVNTLVSPITKQKYHSPITYTYDQYKNGQIPPHENNVLIYFKTNPTAQKVISGTTLGEGNYEFPNQVVDAIYGGSKSLGLNPIGNVALYKNNDQLPATSKPAFAKGGKYSWKNHYGSEYPTNWATGGNLPQPTDNSEATPLASNMMVYNGATHENGGIDLDTDNDGHKNIELENNEVIKDDMVLSDRLYPSDHIKNSIRKLGINIQKEDTYASLAERIGKKKGGWEAKLGSTLVGEHTAAQKMIEKLDLAGNQLFDDQQFQKQMMEHQQHFAIGGNITIPEDEKQLMDNNLEVVDEKQHDSLLSYGGAYKHGGIYIKPSHRGRFTAYKKAHHVTTEQALHSKNPHVRQMANFARNAAKWHHKAFGGYVATDYASPQIPEMTKYKGFNPNGGNSISYYPMGGKFGNFVNENYGDITNALGTLGNQLFINKMQTQYTPTLAPIPQNTYTDRTNYISNRGLANYRSLTQGLNRGSSGDDLGLRSNMYASTLNTTNEALDQEQQRKDAINQNYQQMLQYTNFYNTQAQNQANQYNLQLSNEKLGASQQNFSNFIQGTLGNKAMKESQDLDFAKSYLGYLGQGDTGVGDRLLNKLPQSIRNRYFKGIGTNSNVLSNYRLNPIPKAPRNLRYKTPIFNP